ncbi:hypothetical protein E1171_10845 [Cytophagales bacterium RKSG123]|nr:hypothetical protein [Xanthovirga aplysinae]
MFVLFAHSLKAQDDLLDMLENENQKNSITYANATFKSNRLVNGHSVEMVGEGVLNFVISHKFGRLNSGFYDLFGLDDANIRLGFDYGFSDRFNAGFGRNSFEKTYDGYLKYQLLRQSSGQRTTPITLTAFSSIAINTLKPADESREISFEHRSSYVHQLLIARKFTSNFSLQLMPSWIHHNLVKEKEDRNDIIALGTGARYKLTPRTSLNFEYYYQFHKNAPEGNFNALALGMDIETGGHVFQLFISNSRAMVAKSFISETTGDFLKGDIHFGFNVSRVFNLKKSTENK